MKIALIRARYNPYGGAERFAMRAMQALSAQGADLTIIARSWKDVEVAEFPSPSIPLPKGEGSGSPSPFGRRVGMREVFSLNEEQSSQPSLLKCDPFYIGSLWRDASFARAVQQLLKTRKFDLVQSHERIPGVPVYRAGDGVHAAWLARRAVTLSPLTRLGLKLNPHHRWLLRTERRMFEHPDLQAVICNANMVRDEILQGFAIAPEKLHVIPNGVDLERFHPSVKAQYREAMRIQLGIPPEMPTFVLVGSGFERKGVATALRALAQMRVLCPAMLVVVGSDKRMAVYQDLAQQLGVAAAVRFVGAQRDPLPYYGLADAFVLPTLYDPFPNAALEALACGLPIVVSDACGAKEAVVQGISGWVVPLQARQEQTHSGFANALLLAAQSLVGPERMAMHAAARAAAEPYALANLGAALQSLYKKLTEEKLTQEKLNKGRA